MREAITTIREVTRETVVQAKNTAAAAGESDVQAAELDQLVGRLASMVGRGRVTAEPVQPAVRRRGDAATKGRNLRIDLVGRA